jgi:hypothetical protein
MPAGKDEFAAFSTKDLPRLRIDYLFLDGTSFRFHEHSPAEPVLCAWGIDTNGEPHLVDLAAPAGVSSPHRSEGTRPKNVSISASIACCMRRRDGDAADLLEDGRKVMVGTEQRVDLRADALTGRYSWCHGCRSSF